MNDIPEAEQEAHACIAVNRLNLSRFFEEFQRSVRLFELLERGGGPPSAGVLGGEFIHYRIIAARDGALNIFHFGCALEAVRKQLYRPRFVRHRIACYAARAADESWLWRMAAGVWNPCRSM